MRLRMSSRWCPNGCGKSLDFSIENPKDYLLKCERCGMEFTQQHLRDYWNPNKDDDSVEEQKAKRGKGGGC